MLEKLEGFNPETSRTTSVLEIENDVQI